jgi:CheY-like chemotaxis protein
MVEELGGIKSSKSRAAERRCRFLRWAVVDAAGFDHAMPKMKGVEVAERARRLRPDLPILLVTGYAEPDGLRS